VVTRKSQCANLTVIKIWNIHAINFNSNRYIYTSILIEKAVCFWLPPNTTHKCSLLSSNKYTYSHTRGLRLAPHWCSLSERCSFPFCVFIRINRERPVVCGRKSPPQLYFSFNVCHLIEEKPFLAPFWTTSSLVQPSWATFLYNVLIPISSFTIFASFDFCHTVEAKPCWPPFWTSITKHKTP